MPGEIRGGSRRPGGVIGYPLDRLREETKDGADIRLTLDTRVQKTAEALLSGRLITGRDAAHHWPSALWPTIAPSSPSRAKPITGQSTPITLSTR